MSTFNKDSKSVSEQLQEQLEPLPESREVPKIPVEKFYDSKRDPKKEEASVSEVSKLHVG